MLSDEKATKLAWAILVSTNGSEYTYSRNNINKAFKSKSIPFHYIAVKHRPKFENGEFNFDNNNFIN